MKALKTETQKLNAEYCQALLIAFADLGIRVWIDEATGFQQARDRNALHKLPDKYINSHWAKWSKTFPDENYEHLYRLKGHPFDPDSIARPEFIGRVTADVVYSRLAPGVLEELEK